METTPRQDIGIALVGAGSWGAHHLRIWTELGLLRAVVEPDDERRAVVTRQHPDLDALPSLAAVLSRDDIDGLVLASPATTHAEVALEALAAGKHVLVEKPLAIDVGDATRVLEAAAEHDRVVMVGHVLEYHPVFLELRRLIQDGALGRLRYLYSHRLNFGTLRTEENALWSFAPHDIAMTLRILQEEPRGVACGGGSYISSEVADTTIMQLVFGGGVRAHIYVSWLHPFKEHRFVVIGDRQMAVFDDTAPWQEKLALYPHEVDWMGGKVPVARRAQPTHVHVEDGEPLLLECEAFARAIRTGEPPLTDAASGLRVLKVLDAGERSMALGGAPVTVDEVPA